jgi:hypothetical protein
MFALVILACAPDAPTACEQRVLDMLRNSRHDACREVLHERTVDWTKDHPGWTVASAYCQPLRR